LPIWPPRSAPGWPRPRWPARWTASLVDTSYRIERDARVAIVTERDAEGLDIIRHSTAHLLAYAVKELFPDAQITIGPVIENGFYYDIAYKRPFTPEDLVSIEKQA
jgi:threonyl-tRNA synthetase